MDVLLVHFHGQVDLPDEFTGGALTAMEGFRLYLPGDPPFLTTDAQGITHDAQFRVAASTPGASASRYTASLSS